MAQFDLIVEIDRSVHEQYKVTVTAEDEEEAQDLVYDHFVEFPNADFVLYSRIRTREATHSVEISSIEFERTEAEAVFGDNDDGGDEIA